MWGFTACWHRWRAAQLRRLARRATSIAEQLSIASHRAFVLSLVANDMATAGHPVTKSATPYPNKSALALPKEEIVDAQVQA
jgi:hypothetical protein